MWVGGGGGSNKFEFHKVKVYKILLCDGGPSRFQTDVHLSHTCNYLSTFVLPTNSKHPGNLKILQSFELKSNFLLNINNTLFGVTIYHTTISYSAHKKIIFNKITSQHFKDFKF